MSSVRDFVLETYDDLRESIENGDYVDAFVKDVKCDSRGGCVVFAEALKSNGKRNLLIFREWREYGVEDWKNVLDLMDNNGK